MLNRKGVLQINLRKHMYISVSQIVPILHKMSYQGVM